MPEQQHIPDHVSENIDAVLALRARSEKRLRRDQRAVEAATGVIGRPLTLYVLFGAVALWVGYNLSPSANGGHPFDPPPFFWLQGVIALYAAVMTTIILTTQNRQNKDAERHAHLELQVNLQAEQRTAKIIALLEELRRDLPNVRDRVDPVAEALQEIVPPNAVDSALDHTLNPHSGRKSRAPERDSLSPREG
ncbi:MAG TPA: DUF1003 domain-containing protein [Polyangiaceae bacterium]|jgi:uncharacterized membrane protein|nr:DUF1003 domain-containing protein [Polyangiaceae bacterium]